MKFSDRFAKLTSLKSTWVAAALLAGGVFAAGTPAAHAQHVSAYVGFGTPAYVEPAPVYADPGPAYVVPQGGYYGGYYRHFDRDDYDRDRYMGWRAHEWREHEWREHEEREHAWHEHEEHEHDWR